MKKNINWGILGTGRMAEIFTSELLRLPGCKITAVGSRSAEKAHAFGNRFHISEQFGSYDALVQQSSADIIYVATPHPYHAENAKRALNNGKHVLCEKPFSINAKDAESMIKLAHKTNLFLMDALWIRFTPLMKWLKTALDNGFLGDLGMFSGSFGYAMEFDSQSRVYNPDLGGGALLDVGIYPLSTSVWLMGIPEETKALATLGKTSVDERTGILLKTTDGKISALYTAVVNRTPLDFTVMGKKGIITVHGPWGHQDRLTYYPKSGEAEEKKFAFDGRGYGYMAQHVMNCIREGKAESPVISHDETLSIMKIMDQIREQIGLKYPME